MTELKAALYSVIKAMVGDETLIFAHQNAPRPAQPFWTIMVHSQKRVGTDYYGQGVSDEGDETVTGTREATVALQRVGPNSESEVDALRDALSKTSIRDLWSAYSMACYDAGDVKNIPSVLDNSQWESRAALDLFIRYSVQLVDRVGIIDTINLSRAEE